MIVDQLHRSQVTVTTVIGVGIPEESKFFENFPVSLKKANFLFRTQLCYWTILIKIFAILKNDNCMQWYFGLSSKFLLSFSQLDENFVLKWKTKHSTNFREMFPVFKCFRTFSFCELQTWNEENFVSGMSNLYLIVFSVLFWKLRYQFISKNKMFGCIGYYIVAQSQNMRVSEIYPMTCSVLYSNFYLLIWGSCSTCGFWDITLVRHTDKTCKLLQCLEPNNI